MNKQYILKRDYLEALKIISECQQEIQNQYSKLDEAYYGFGPYPSNDWRDTVLGWIDFHRDSLTEADNLRVRYESKQHKLQTLKECKSKKPLGWHDIDPDDIDFDDIDSPNFFEVQFSNPWK